MIRKIIIFCFILLGIFLTGFVSGAEMENETPTLEIETQEINIDSHDIDMYYKDGTRFGVNITDESSKAVPNATVNFTLNGVSYERQTDERGHASIALNLNSGKYIMTTGLNEVSINNTINIKSTIESGDIVKIYKNSTQYEAKFINSKGELIRYEDVKFNINGIFYTRTTNEYGIARLSINLIPGTYILTATNPVTLESKSNNITVLSTITNNKDLIKYYRNTSNYMITLLSKNGQNVGSGERVEFNINGMIYQRYTNIFGIASLSINLNPGKYIITANYDGCRVSNFITVLSTIITEDMKMGYKDGSKFKVRLVDGGGNPLARQDFSININGVFYTRTTNSDGIGTLNINLNVGEYTATTEHNGLKVSNKITIVDKIEKQETTNTNFSYTIEIPNYVNVTYPYVVKNTAYAIKDGIDGIIRMDKNQIFNVEIANKTYSFSTNVISGSIALGSEYYLLHFDGSSYQHGYNLSKLNGNGIIIHNAGNCTQLIYRNNCTSNFEQFGAYIDRGIQSSENIYYIQDGIQKARVNFYTYSYDDFGLKYLIATYHGASVYDFNYKDFDTITRGNSDKIKFVNTNESVTLDYFGRNIAGYLSEEYITTRFNSTNCIEFEKSEMITYGLSDKYKRDFDVLQSFAIINDEVHEHTMSYWLIRQSEYKSNAGMESMYMMFLTGLNTAFLSDTMANNLSGEYDISWSRNNNTVILGGMNWQDSYLHVLTPDMGRLISGMGETNKINFRFANSILLSKIEEYCLKPIAEDANDNITTAYSNILNAIASKNFTIAYINNTGFIFDETTNSTFVIDLNNGLVSAIAIKDNFAYKGATITRDCGLCSITSMLKNVMRFVNNIYLSVSNSLGNSLDFIQDNVVPLSQLAVKGSLFAKVGIGIIFQNAAIILTPISFATGLQSIGVEFTNKFVDDSDLHTVYEHFTFTRAGPLQNTKIYNIPQEDGGTDYVRVHIKSNGELDRTYAQYISDGNVRYLTEEETYQYFNEEYWSPFTVPQKYWANWN